MSSKIVLVICVLVAVAAAIPAQGGPGGWGGAGGWGGGGGWGGAAAGGWGGAAAGGWGGPGGWGAGVNPWIPPWVATAPWYPQWVSCTGVGSSCLDCNTRLVCTKVGGLQRACTDPTLPYCNLGECSATPSEGCGPVPAVPAEAAA